jgi:hypothetical protein
MNAKYLALFGALSLAAIGCAGEFQPGDGNGPGPAGVDAGTLVPEADASVEESDVGTAQALFENNVRPIIGSACNPGGACHASQDPAFVTADPNAAYNTIGIHKDRLYTGFDPATSRLLINGEGGHYGALYTDDDVEAIEAWLTQEKLDADAGGGQLVSAMQEWSGCMNLEDWENRNVASLWADKDAQNQGDCDACHNLGADGFMASNDSVRVFENITTNPSLMPSYFTQSTDGLSVVINRARLEKVGNQLSPHEAHGAFNVEGGAMDALELFYQDTLARQANQAIVPCEPPRF